MRMDTTRGPTVADWLAQASVDEMREVIADYGEERFAFQVAKAIAARRATRPLRTTLELAECVASAVRTREKGQHPATRTFQALRIYINRELEELARTLASALDLLAREVGGDQLSFARRPHGQCIAAAARPAAAYACPCAKAKCPSPCCIPLAASRPRTMKWRSMPAPVPPCCARPNAAPRRAGRRRSRLRAYGFLPGSDLAVPRKGGKGGRR